MNDKKIGKTKTPNQGRDERFDREKLPIMNDKSWQRQTPRRAQQTRLAPPPPPPFPSRQLRGTRVTTPGLNPP